MNELGKRIKKLREKQNIFQKRLATALGISNVQLSRYESGDRKPDPETITAIANFFDVSTDYLLGRTDIPEPTTHTVAGQEIELTPEEAKVFQEMKKHPQFAPMFHDLATNPEKKVKTLIRMWEVIKGDLEEEEDRDDIIED
nr:hypothetical protein 4 [Bacillales bacterium]